MTTPALEKAAAVIEAVERDGYRFLEDLGGHQESTLIAYIAKAITEAEDEKLEEFAAALEVFDDYGNDIIETSPSNVAALARSLKSKQGT